MSARRGTEEAVGSYFHKQASSPRIQMMLSQVASIEVTASRSEARRCCSRTTSIKSSAALQHPVPRRQVLSVLTVTGHEFPVSIPPRREGPAEPLLRPVSARVRGAREIQLLQRVFPLAPARTRIRESLAPLLLHQIRRCTALAPVISAGQYAEDVATRAVPRRARGRRHPRLTEKMSTDSTAQRYEEATGVCDQVRALSQCRAPVLDPTRVMPTLPGVEGASLRQPGVIGRPDVGDAALPVRTRGATAATGGRVSRAALSRSAAATLVVTSTGAIENVECLLHPHLVHGKNAEPGMPPSRVRDRHRREAAGCSALRDAALASRERSDIEFSSCTGSLVTTSVGTLIEIMLLEKGHHSAR